MFGYDRWFFRSRSCLRLWPALLTTACLTGWRRSLGGSAWLLLSGKLALSSALEEQSYEQNKGWKHVEFGLRLGSMERRSGRANSKATQRNRTSLWQLLRALYFVLFLIGSKRELLQSTKYKVQSTLQCSDGYTSAALQELSVPSFAFERAVVHHYFAA